MQFRYRGKDDRGILQQGSLVAANADAAASELVRRGITPLTIREQQEQASLVDRLNKMPLFRKKVTLDELIVFAARCTPSPKPAYR